MFGFCVGSGEERRGRCGGEGDLDCAFTCGCPVLLEEVNDQKGAAYDCLLLASQSARSG